MVVETEKTVKPGSCLMCHNDVGLFRRLTKNQFCTDKHEEEYMDELKEVALGRLLRARSRLTCRDKTGV